MTTDLFVKPTSVNQYLSPESCHPSHIWRNIPYSLAFRLRRICSEDQDFEDQLLKLRDLLIERGYRIKVIENAFDRVRRLLREHTLEKVMKPPSDKTTFVITFDPRLTSIPGVIHKHARTLMLDSRMKETFSEGFQVAFKRHRNVREFLCRARLYDIDAQRKNQRAVTRGWRRCNRCVMCSRSKNLSRFECSSTKKIHQISEDICCKDVNIIYLI